MIGSDTAKPAAPYFPSGGTKESPTAAVANFASLSRAEADSPPRGPRPSRVFLAAMLLSVAFMAVVGMRETIVRKLPRLAPAYAAIGLPVNLAGLEIRRLKSTLQKGAAEPVLAIEGQLVNVRSRPVAVPRLRIGIDGSDGYEIYHWTTVPPKPKLAEGETIDFRVRLTAPPAGARMVLVKFAAPSE